MGKGRDFLERLAQTGDLCIEAAPGLPLVEISGSRRVLIENHFGIRGYSRERILVNVSYGYIVVCGCGLELARMTKEQLVIRGRIDGIMLQRRGST